MDETIDIRGILDHMDSGRPFDMTYVTADVKKRTGGRLVTVRKAIKTGYKVKDGTQLTAAMLRKLKGDSLPEKNPNHFENFTRNILLQGQEVRTVHIDLITRFNGKKVL